MCTRDDLQLLSKALSPMRSLISVYLFVAGCIIAGNVHLAQAFGRGITAVGATLIIFSIWNIGAGCMMYAGMTRHNKFVILSAVCIDIVLAIIQVTLGLAIYSKTVPEFGRNMQLDCLLKDPVSHTLEECLEFTRSDRYAAMMLVWRSYNTLALDYTKYYRRVVSIEQDGSCCGFGPPARCTADARDFPRWASKSKVGFLTEKRYVCGTEDKWYDETYFCSQFVDKTDIFPVIGGCKYDYPLGQCMNTDVDASVSLRGCAAELEAHIKRKILPHSIAITGLSAVTLASVLAGCCMFWKRVHIDSMPDHVDRHLPWDPFKDKERRRASLKRGVGGASAASGKAVKLDPLEVLIMGEMPDDVHDEITPI